MEDVIEGMRVALAVRIPNAVQSSRFRQSLPMKYLTAQYVTTKSIVSRVCVCAYYFQPE